MRPMKDCCNDACASPSGVDPRFGKALWIALAANVLMFIIEVGAGIRAGSASLLADAGDFLADAGNYGLSLFVFSMAAVWRSRAALVKGLSMGAYGAIVLVVAAYGFQLDGVPGAATMGIVGFLALAVNAGVALMLYRFRSGDANMRSVWLCSRNDAIGNVAVMLAAAGVFGTRSRWPDLLVAAVMASLALASSIAIVRQSLAELRASQKALA